jgi:hypothetical protein
VCEFNDEIMKLAQGNLYKIKFHMKKLSMNLSVIKRESKFSKFKINTVPNNN